MKKRNLYHLFGTVLLAFAVYSCKKEEQESNKNRSPETHIEQQNKITVKESSKKTEGKKSPSDFVPEGYVIFKYEGGISAGAWDEIKGDLNKDGLDDIVLIIKGTDKSKIIQDESRGELDRNRRGIIILMNKGDHYELASKNLDCFSSENEDGGVYFAPELDFQIEKGNLIIGYGHGRYGNWSYTFRYQNGDMELIGYDSYVSQGPVPQYIVSINFLTGKKLTKDNLNKDDDGDNYVEKFKDTWENIKVKKLIRLSEIKDFDELNIDG
ncbi:hypothetical protein [Epilithonimonas arachidiradicis]|uniref:Uncharacterized protein n=1 Tax=Epilithonimonas arachidiradicis TaxID=1617282 RepID=A0A420CKT3_9FLAO|nr:hypothetical protein [Epilithonimonas arachidiradicis]RKE79097.1 hypothetical protein BXY58_3359 [Epilithonimonas arachidiradicis]GGG60213.1 hypothetical protein GCM10007332_22350 [Epilithonimonas arachidiradicis]